MKRLGFFVLMIMLVALVGAVSGQDMMGPEVTVSDQNVLDGTVTVDYVFSEGPGFIVIHADNGEGSFGAVIGNRLLSPGANYNVTVDIDATAATSTLYAMLHVDTGEAGVYEFGAVEGADGPVVIDGAPVSPPFAVSVINADDQFVEGSFTATSATIDVNGWLVIHADNDGAPGPVIGVAPLTAGINTDVTVELEGDVTSVLWPMLHVDTGVEGEYEFGTVEGADGPVVLNGVSVVAVGTNPTIKMNDQIVLNGDGMMMDDMMMLTATADFALSEGPGFIVIHADNEGAPGPVAGFAPVAAGANYDVVIELDSEMVTPVLWPMLHVDTGVEGEYEFGTVEGADGPVVVDEQVVVFPINAAPAIDYNTTIDGDVITVSSALIDAPGWLVIHADNDGAPGAVIGVAPLTPGLNSAVAITVDTDGLTETVFPMLHYDTGEAGVYEFGTVEGADAPVFVGGNVVVGPSTPEAMME